MSFFQFTESEENPIKHYANMINNRIEELDLLGKTIGDT